MIASVSATDINSTDDLSLDIPENEYLINDNNFDEMLSVDAENVEDLSISHDDEKLEDISSQTNYSFDDVSDWNTAGTVSISESGYDGSCVVLDGRSAYISKEFNWDNVEKVEFWYKLSSAQSMFTVTIGDEIIPTTGVTEWTHIEYDTTNINGNNTLKFLFNQRSQKAYIDSLVLTFNHDNGEERTIQINTYVNTPVDFNYTTTDNIDKWYWDFGDGSHSNESSPTHTYNETGMYNANLTITIGSNSNIIYYVVEVSDKLVADFSYIQHGNSFTFFDGSSGNIVNYTLNFGDNNKLDFTKWTYGGIVHQYSNAGFFDVTLTVTDKIGNSANATHTIKIYNSIPHVVAIDSFENDEDSWILNDTAYRTFDQSIDGNASIHIEVSSVQENMFVMKKELNLDNIDLITIYGRTISSDKGSSSSSKIYMYIDDTQVDGYVSIINFNTWHSNTFDVSSFFGTHNVTLTAYIIPGSGVWIDNIKYQNYQNIANFTVSTPKVENNEVSITFTDKSTGIISGYLWEFDDGTNTTSRNPTHTFSHGNHSVILRIYHDGVEVDNCSYQFSLSLPIINGTSYGSIQEAINNAKENDVIDIAPDMIFNENLVLNQTLILNFNGAVLHAKDSTIPALNITNGATVTITNVGLDQNSAMVTSDNSKLIITDSNIKVNLDLNEGNIDLLNDNFNNAELTLIANTNISSSNILGGRVIVKGNTILNNISLTDNGNILTVDETSKLTIKDSTISNAKIELQAGNITVTDIAMDNSQVTSNANTTLINVNAIGSEVLVSGGKSKITKSTFTGSDVAIAQTGGELELTNNIIKDNNVALNITTSSATISLNAIYNNTSVNINDTATVTNNWFGTNQVTGFESYLRLFITAPVSEMYPGKEYTITAELIPNTGSLEGSIDNLTLEFTSPNGETTPVTINNNNGEFKFTAGQITDEVTLKLFNEDYTLVNGENPVSIVAEPLDTNITITSPENGVVVIRLSTAEGNVSGANVSYTINGGNKVNNVTDANGQIIIKDLTGKVTINATYDGNKTLNPSAANKAFDFTIATVITAANVSTTYGAAKELIITLTANGNALANKTINVTVGTINKNLTTNASGQVSVDVSGLNPDTYVATIAFTGDEVYVKSNANASVVINKVASSLSAPAVSATYNVAKNLVITLTANGKALNGQKVTVKVGTISKTLTTNAKGQVSVAISSLVPKTYQATISFAGDKIYTASSTTAKVVVVKAKSKITAKKATFKAKKKTKKYTITLKAGKKAISKVKVTLKVKGKTYKAKTNAKGKATFKINKLTKKGKHTATIKFAGNKYYKASTKKVKLTVKK